jgi:hypothetical protein
MARSGGGSAPVAARLPRGIFAKLKGGGARVNLNGVLHGDD